MAEEGKPMRLGKVRLACMEYVVDLDDEDMVDHAKEAIYENVRDAAFHEAVFDNRIEMVEDKEAKPEDILSFLRPGENK